MTLISSCVEDSQLTHIQRLELLGGMCNELKDLHVKIVK